MRNKLPISLSLAALVVALLGAVPVAQSHGVFHAIFAHKAGAVDGKSAVSAGATLNRAAGKLVATKARGTDRGKFVKKFIPKVDSAFNADNATNAATADKLDGFDANQLARGSATTSTVVNDNFDTCAFTDILTKQVTVPTNGVLLAWGSTEWEFDFSFTGLAILETRLAVGGSSMSTEQQASAEDLAAGNDSYRSNSNSGAVALGAGTHTVALQARECGGGAAFIRDKSITTLFVPFGDSGAQGALRPLSLRPSGNQPSNAP